MRKILMLLIAVIGIAASALAQVPAATISAAKTAKAGESITVTINIKKCDLACYAQYQQLLPEGMVAKEISGKSDNANFYFENNKVFYQWYKLPVDKNDIQLQFTITMSEGIKPGKYQLPGYFSYQVNNRLGEINTTAEIEVK